MACAASCDLLWPWCRTSLPSPDHRRATSLREIERRAGVVALKAHKCLRPKVSHLADDRDQSDHVEHAVGRCAAGTTYQPPSPAPSAFGVGALLPDRFGLVLGRMMPVVLAIGPGAVRLLG